MNNKWITLLFFSVITTTAFAQEVSLDPMLQPLKWRNIGPANPGGRIVDIEALDNDYRKVWLATASGGVWYSQNAGTTWSPIFDRYETASIGDIAVFQPNPDIIWVATGEANNRNSVSWGNGVYKSVDGGKSFENVGLKNTHHIGRVVLHPSNPDVAYVAAVGHLWGDNEERGLYKTADGGKSWQLLKNGLPQAGKEGCTDLVMDPADPDVLYAAFYYRIRTGYNFFSGSASGGIFKSVDAGQSWRKLTQGLPADSTGRIGLAISRSNPNILMAIVEAKKTDTLSIPGSGIYRSEDKGEHWQYVNTYNNRPFYYSQVRINPKDANKIYVLTTPYMVSNDAGKSFKNGSADEEIHGDFHALWFDPANPERYYIGADKGASFTQDGGKKFLWYDNLPIAQYYRIATDMNTPYRIYGGLQDNGFYATESFSRDARGILNDANWKVHWGDGQYTAINPNNKNEVFTSSENGSVLKLNPQTHELKSISPNIFNTINARSHLQKGSDQPFYRFNWSAPFFLSAHDNKTIYMGSQYVLKTADHGKSWTIISPDLSSGDSSKIKTGGSGGITPDNTGAENFGTVYTLSQSPINKNVLWAGTDDGLLHLTTDEGKNWKRVNASWPTEMNGLWIDRIVASNFNQRSAYAIIDGHRSNVFKPFIMATDDGGENWRSLTGNLPADEVLRSFIEDPVNENLLFAGTETGVWVSVNKGVNWQRLNKNLPTVSVYDLKIHPREKDLIAATHGRSLWVMDDIGYLQQFTPQVAKSTAWLFDQRPVVLWENTSRGGQRGHMIFAGENPPGFNNTSSLPRASTMQSVFITCFVNSTQKVALTISDVTMQKKVTIDTTLSAGIHRIPWDLHFDAPLLTPKNMDYLDSLVKSIPGGERAALTATRRIRQTKNAQEQRQQVQRLKDTNPGIPIPEQWLPVKAKPGTFIINLKTGTLTRQRQLIIKADPISKP